MILSSQCVAANWPSTRGIRGVARNLARAKDLTSGELVTAKAIRSEFPSQQVLLFSDTDKLVMKANPGVNGTFDLRIAHLSGGAFAQFTVFADGIEIGKSKVVSGKTEAVVSTFKTPMLTSHNVELEFRLAKPGELALIYIDWKNTAFETVPAEAWQMTQLNGYEDLNSKLPIEQTGDTGMPAKIGTEDCRWKKVSGQRVTSLADGGALVAVSHFNRESAWGCLDVKLEADGEAVLSVNGIVSLHLKPGQQVATTLVKPQKMQHGLNRFVVRMPGKKAAGFTLSVSPGSGQFMADIPDLVNPKLNIDNWPRAEISNGRVSAVVALPDSVKGFYRGPRFDHSSSITELKCKGHTFFGINARGQRNPVGNDNAAGPAEAFFEPLGFDDAKINEGFIKVGVGILAKPYARSYFFGTSYWPIKFFDWKVETSADSIKLRQQVDYRGFGYDYQRTISLPKDKDQLVISYTFKNTGSKRITTSQYAHNFIKIDGHDPDSNYTVKFSSKVRAVRPLPVEPVYKDGTSFTMPGRTMFSPVDGFKSSHDNRAEVSYKGKTGIRIMGDFVPFRYWLFASTTVVCPEPFVRVDLAPGESMSWTRTYEFFAE